MSGGVAAMMSLTLMAPAAWRYYVEEIARGREDYYARSAERPGRFIGRGAEVLRISGSEADALSLERLFGHGTDPRDGSPLGRSFDPDNDRAVAGFALTFSPPKSVSVMWAVAEQATSDQVLAAHEAAVAAAFVFVDDHASFTRRGHNGVLQVDTDGLIAASFVHRTSRAVDPQLHTHLLVANKVCAVDRKWLSIDGRELFETQKAAGMLYKAALRSELSTRLGVEWTSVDENGVAEIVGVPRVLVEQWSARRHELKAVGDELIASREVEFGRSLSPNERTECFQIAAYRTRTPKVDAGTSTAELRSHWLAEAQAWGLGPDRWLAGVTDRPPRSVDVRAEEVVSAVIARLEKRSATWGRADLIEELTCLLTGKDAEEVRDRAEVLTDRVLRDAEVVSLAGPLPAEAPTSLRRRDGMAAIERHGAVRFSTRATLQREAAILEAAAAGHDARAAVVDARDLDRVLAPSVLGEDQREAVRELLTGGERVALLVGPAGTGKSRALDTARACWERAGYEPIGLAPSAMAASVLREEAGLRAETLAKFLIEITRDNSPLRLDGRSVVILDEAGMARTDDLARLLRAVGAAKAKLVLVGDPHQLGAVGPGGIFRTLVADHGAHELETVRRFHHAWEAAASLRLRERDPAILPAYVRHDRIVGGSREQMIDRAFAAWLDAREKGTSLLLMAGDNATADELSRRCRAELVTRGLVDRDGVRIATGIASCGDEVVTLQNDRRLRPTHDDFVRNGARWRVVGTFPDGSMRVVSDDTGGAVTLQHEYVREHVALGYTLTIHKAQGKTADRAIALVDEKMTSAQLYVAMSRGREENRAFVICSDDQPEDHVRRPSVNAIEALARIMCRDEVDRSAHDVLRRGLARYDDVALLDALHEEARREILDGAGPDRSKEIKALEPKANVAGAIDSLHRAEEHLGHTEVRRREAEDRLAEVDHEPMRARLPGRLGADARYRADEVKRYARSTLGEARRDEQEDLRRCEAARSRLTDAERAANELEQLREAQTRRESWLSAHPQEVRWELDLQERIGKRLAERGNARLNAQIAGRDIENRSTGPSRLPRAKELPAVERPAKRPRTPTPMHSPPPPSRGPEYRGPALGR
jgi:conjugative relaxase-like TrwC/TraI family protein